MTTFNEQYGEGKLEEFLALLEEKGLDTSVSINHKNQLMLTWVEEGTILIRFSDRVWEIESMRSSTSGLYDTLVQLTPFAKSLGILTFTCNVTDKMFSEKLTTMGFRRESETRLFAPLDHIQEYAEWCVEGKLPENEPIWRKSL